MTELPELTDEIRAAVVAEQTEAALKALQDKASTWDADEWLRGANLPTETVTLTARPGLAAAIDAAAAALEPAAGKPRTYADRSSTPSRKDAAAKLEALWAEYDASKRDFTVRARKPGDQEAIAKAMKDAGATYSPERALIFATAHYLVDPVLTAEQVQSLADKLGSAQFDTLCEAWLKLSSEVPSVPLSSRPSAGRVTKAS